MHYQSMYDFLSNMIRNAKAPINDAKKSTMSFNTALNLRSAPAGKLRKDTFDLHY